ncbi:hypothetical protein Sme01_14540 [Sphaerisporangium melleum]|uniref:Uncharacterized protein n=1 Tax=Sphaerisporangium melleum TaxID=321316 RepID=A0A917QVB3_9ACTN|nr:hypothetical protein [Sphaerisporangium melleum]GGK69165.1 hypothetical protein GCM10007964_10140 [Sphaerisporangium melleum]GII68978.1 hypothetical protein Sme01_14540 [Sphaerisporangium melleum]
MLAAVALLVVMVVTVAMFEITVNNRQLQGRPQVPEPAVPPGEQAQSARDFPNVPNA